MAPRNEQAMAGEHRAVVEERNAIRVLVNDRSGEVPPRYFAEDTARRGHTSPLAPVRKGFNPKDPETSLAGLPTRWPSSRSPPARSFVPSIAPRPPAMGCFWTRKL